MKKFILVLLLILIPLFAFACLKKSTSDLKNDDALIAEGDPSYYGGISGKEGIPSGEYFPSVDGMPDGDVYMGEGRGEGGDLPNQEYPAAGQLTSSACFDNDNYEFWLTLVNKGQQEAGLFNEYFNKYSFKTANRIKVTVPNTSYVKVTVDGFSSVTDANGEAYLFPTEVKSEYQATFSYLDESGNAYSLEKTITRDYTLDVSELNNPMTKKDVIQLLFVIDTTGSMGDEITYLKSEIADVIETIKQDNEGVLVELGLIFYRDQGDLYVVRDFPFTTEIEKQVKNLSEQWADGGGDFPEDITSAFKKANEFQWRQAATKILVHVADAPDHDYAIESWNKCVLSMAEKGIRIVTVASSGIDKATEYFYRSECLLTNGVYGFITNDSGIGGGHIEATTPEKLVVEYLNAMLVRLISGIHSGEFSEPVPWKGLPEVTFESKKEEIEEIYKNVEYFTGSYSVVSSYLAYSKNEYVIRYLFNLISKIDFKYLRDPNYINDLNFELDYSTINFITSSDKRLKLLFKENIYIVCHSEDKVEWVFVGGDSEAVEKLTLFVKQGGVFDHCFAEPVCTKYYDTGILDAETQEKIVKAFTRAKAPISEYVEDGTLFSGSIRKYCGKFDECYAVLVDGCGLLYTEAEWTDTVDAVAFNYNDGNQLLLVDTFQSAYTLKEAFEKGLISHDDLVSISEALNNN